MGLARIERARPGIFLFSFVSCLSLQAGWSFIQSWPYLAEVALPPSTGPSATLGDGLAEACQRSPSSYDDGAADGTTGLAGHKVQASVHGEAASSTSVPARSADNGIGCPQRENRRWRMNQGYFQLSTLKCCHRWRRLPLSNDLPRGPVAYPGKQSPLGANKTCVNGPSCVSVDVTLPLT